MNAAYNNIARYGTKGDFVLQYYIDGAFDAATMKKSQGHEVIIPLLAYQTSQKLEESKTSFTLYVAIDDDFSGAIPSDSKVIHNDVTYNVVNSDTKYVRGAPIFSTLLCNG